MITITINGLDQFVVGRLSRDLTKSLANLYEVKEEDINFVAPNSMVFHDGVEQTSWHVLVTVSAPKKVQVIQKQVAEFLIESIKDVAIHVEVLFAYYLADEHIERINHDYPRFITEENIVNVDEEADHNHEDDDELYDGDIFNELEGKVKGK